MVELIFRPGLIMKIVEDKGVELVAGGSVINGATLSRFTYLKKLKKSVLM